VVVRFVVFLTRLDDFVEMEEANIIPPPKSGRPTRASRGKKIDYSLVYYLAINLVGQPGGS
jgi:hypothetical protein